MSLNPDNAFGPSREETPAEPRGWPSYSGKNIPDRDEFEYGGMMEIGRQLRSTIDRVSEEYDVHLQYDEGRVHIRGDRDEVQEFVAEVTGAEQVMQGADHPVDSFTPNASIGATMEAYDGFQPRESP